MAEGAGGSAAANQTSQGQNSTSQGQDSTEGASGDIWALKFSYEYATTRTSSTSDDVTIVLGSSLTAQTVQSITSTMNLVDCLWMNGKANCNLPAAAQSPQVEMFIDARFGTMMGVLPDLTIKPPAMGRVSWQGHAADAALLKSLGLTESHILQLPGHLDVPLLRQPVPKKVPVTGVVPLPLVRPAAGAVAPLDQKWAGRVF